MHNMICVTGVYSREIKTDGKKCAQQLTLCFDGSGKKHSCQT